MSIVTVRFYEIQIAGKWIPAIFNSKLAKIEDQLISCDEFLYNSCREGIPEDISEEINNIISLIGYKRNVGYCDKYDLENLQALAEEQFIESLENAKNLPVEDYANLSDRRLLLEIYKSLNVNIRDIYLDMYYPLYGITCLYSEMTTILNLLNQNNISNIRVIFYTY